MTVKLLEMIFFGAFVDRHVRAVNISLNLVLLTISLLCYVLYLILFLSPQSFRISSLVYPQPGNVKPAVVIGLIAAIFTSSTSALVARAVEESLWIKLDSRPVRRQLTVAETRRLAHWSVSPLSRLLYVVEGSSWALKISGILLIGTSTLNAVIVSGVSQVEQTSRTVSAVAPQAFPFHGWIDQSNRRYNGGVFRDVPGVVAALVVLNNQTAPAARVCQEGDSCSVQASVATIRARCRSGTKENPSGIGGGKPTTRQNTTFCSEINDEICVTLKSASPYTYANFTSGYSPLCGDAGLRCPGAFATIFGVYINSPETGLVHTLNLVDCALNMGTLTIRQTGQNPPAIVSDSFRPSKADAKAVPEMSSMYRIYTEFGDRASPYTFVGTAVGTGSNSIFLSPVGTLLLGEDANRTASAVAGSIQDAFEMATLLAFGRSPVSSPITYTRQTTRPMYNYDPRVLGMLLVPLLATLFGLFGRWRVGAARVNIGYDPVEIARSGPVGGVPARCHDESYEFKQALDEEQVWGHQWQDVEEHDGQGAMTRNGLTTAMMVNYGGAQVTSRNCTEVSVTPVAK